MVWPTQIVSDLRLQDVVDILFLSGVVYCLYAWFWGTKAVRALVGLVALAAVFGLARLWGLFLTTWVLQILWQVAVLLVIILFQPELRQMLERVSPFRWLRSKSVAQPGEWMTAVVEGAFSLARSRLGALIVVERGDRVDEWTSKGVLLHAQATVPLLVALFQKESPLHDGAVVMRGGEVLRAACYLPLSPSESLPQQFGTRHRAALGLSERCDALVVVASEERGRVSVASGGQVQELERPEDLWEVMSAGAQIQRPTGVGRWVTEALTRRLPAKVLSLVLVSAVWVALAGKQNVEVRISVPVETRNLPEQWEILEPHDPRVQLVLRGMRKDVMTLNDSRVFAEVDLSLARLGRRTFRISRNEIVLPSDRVQVVRIEPSEIKFRFQEKK